jgi:hypothetical protein
MAEEKKAPVPDIFEDVDAAAEKDRIQNAMETKQELDEHDAKQAEALAVPPPKRQRAKDLKEAALPPPMALPPPLPRPRKRQKTTKGPGRKKPPKASIPTDDTPLKENSTYQLLCAYGRSDVVGPVLRQQGHDLAPATLRKVPPQFLPVVLEEVEEVLDNVSNNSFANTSIAKTMEFIEAIIATRTPWRVNGTTEACFENDHWVFLLERMKLKAGLGITPINPVVEFAMVTAQTAAAVHQTNMQQPLQDMSRKTGSTQNVQFEA